jgi:hypothetical protein
MRITHQIEARRRSAFGKAAKNFHSSRARKRSIIGIATDRAALVRLPTLVYEQSWSHS